VKFLDGFLSLMDRMPRLLELEGGSQSHHSIEDLHKFQILELEDHVTLLALTGVQQEAEIADLKEQLRELRDQPEVQMLELRLEMQNELKIKLHRPSGLH
jgi:hypothetical protein